MFTGDKIGQGFSKRKAAKVHNRPSPTHHPLPPEIMPLGQKHPLYLGPVFCLYKLSVTSLSNRPQRAPSVLTAGKDTAKRPSVNQEVGPHQIPNLPAPSSCPFQPPELWDAMSTVYKLPGLWYSIRVAWNYWESYVNGMIRVGGILGPNFNVSGQSTAYLLNIISLT